MAEHRSAAPREPGAVIWFTGLSGAGKSTIAVEVVAALQRSGLAVEHLDGDAIRDLMPGIGFSRADRDAHVKRVGFMASRLAHHGVTVVVSLVSPYQAARDFVRGLCDRFIEVYVSTPLAVCEARDVKQLYARARRGEITGMTGVDDPYERPRQPELEIDTSHTPLPEAVSLVVGAARSTHKA